MRNSIIIGAVLIAGAIGLFFGVTEPQWQIVQELEDRNQRLDEALTRAGDLQEVRNNLRSKFNLMDPDDLDRLEKFLPDTIDSVRLILDVDNLARKNNIAASSFSLETVAAPSPASNSVSEGGAEEGVYATLSLSLAARGSYEDFILFLRDIEQSLRLIDVVSFDLSRDEEAVGAGRNLQHTYQVAMRTYWLR